MPKLWHTLYCIIRAHPIKTHRLMAIGTVYRQQRDLFDKKEFKHRVVSIDRPYIRSIVRGKSL